MDLLIELTNYIVHTASPLFYLLIFIDKSQYFLLRIHLIVKNISKNTFLYLISMMRRNLRKKKNDPNKSERIF